MVIKNLFADMVRYFTENVHFCCVMKKLAQNLEKLDMVYFNPSNNKNI